MAKVLYNGNYIELKDELEPGYKELDLLTDVKSDLDDLEDTIVIDSINLEDTQKLDLGDLNE